MKTENKRILIVDDDKLLVNELEDILYSEGFEVDCVYDGNSVVEKLQKHEYSCILLDLKLTGVSGMKLLSEKKIDDNTKVIVMSGHPVLSAQQPGCISCEDDLFKTLLRRTVGCLGKPFEIPRLLQMLDRILQE